MGRGRRKQRGGVSHSLGEVGSLNPHLRGLEVVKP